MVVLWDLSFINMILKTEARYVFYDADAEQRNRISRIVQDSFYRDLSTSYNFDFEAEILAITHTTNGIIKKVIGVEVIKSGNLSNYLPSADLNNIWIVSDDGNLYMTYPDKNDRITLFRVLKPLSAQKKETAYSDTHLNKLLSITSPIGDTISARCGWNISSDAWKSRLNSLKSNERKRIIQLEKDKKSATQPKGSDK